MYLDFNGPFPSKNPGLSCAAKSPMFTILNIVTVEYYAAKNGSVLCSEVSDDYNKNIVTIR